MTAITLKRVAMADTGTFGVLIDGGVPFAVTLERPWTDNRPHQSCIPEGGYQCRRVASPKFGETFEVEGVPGRSHILFHRGNTADETEGCILVGERFGALGGRAAALGSREGMGELMARLKGAEAFRLEVEDHYGKR